MLPEVHTFDNGIKVHDSHLLPVQRARYKEHNVHEADEEELFIRIIRALPPKGVYLDIGAAIGYYALLARSLSPGLLIHAVEALPRHREWFRENIRLNGMDPAGFVIHPESIAAANGESEFIDRSYGSALLRPGEKVRTPSLRARVKLLLHSTGIRKDPSRTKVATRTLDDLLKDVPGGHVDLCQMDVQGFELDILKGASNALQFGSVATFLIGTHSPELHSQCMAMLKQHDYVIEFEEQDTKAQPDGIVVASKGCLRLSP